MAEPRERPPYSYRTDPSVPDFDDEAGPIAFMDGECALCTGGARLIARLDRRRAFRICPISTPLGTAIVRHYGLEPDDPETWLLLEDGRASAGMEAIIRIGERLGGVGRLASAMRLAPRPLRDWLYLRIAFNRRRLGRADLCTVPDPELRARLLLGGFQAFHDENLVSLESEDT